MKEILQLKQSNDDILKGYQSEFKPFLLIDNTKNKNIQKPIVLGDNENVNSLENKPKENNIMTKLKHVYHRKDGRWEYVYTKNKQKAYLIASTREKLITKIQEFKKEQRVIKKSTAETLYQYALKWLSVYKTDISKDSQDTYKSVIETHIKPKFKNTPLKTIGQEEIQKFINNIKGERVKEYVFLTIRQILKQAYINNKIEKNLSDMLQKPRRKKKANKTALSLEEQIKFMQELEKTDKDTQLFMLFSIILGTRRSETLAFKFEDINIEKNLLHVKGTKTQQSDRRIKISDSMIELLQENMQGKQNQFYFQFSAYNYTEKARKIFRKLKLEKTLHDLRHTCSTNLYYLGVSDKQRQQILGHASIVMTNDIYTNLQEDIDKEGLIKLYNNLYFQY